MSPREPRRRPPGDSLHGLVGGGAGSWTMKSPANGPSTISRPRVSRYPAVAFDDCSLIHAAGVPLVPQADARLVAGYEIQRCDAQGRRLVESPYVDPRRPTTRRSHGRGRSAASSRTAARPAAQPWE